MVTPEQVAAPSPFALDAPNQSPRGKKRIDESQSTRLTGSDDDAPINGVTPRPQFYDPTVRTDSSTIDPEEEAVRIVYGGRTASAQRDEENRQLRAQLNAMRAERKRARSTGETEGPAKRARTDVPLGPPIDLATINAVRTMYAREAAFQKELHKNPYVQFAIFVADQETGGKDKYKYINSVHKNMLDRLYSGASKSMDHVTAAANAMRVLGSTLRAFPGSAEELGDVDLQDSFARLYTDLANAVSTMQQRAYIMEELQRLSHDDVNVDAVIAPELVLRAQQVLDTARGRFRASVYYPPMSLDMVISDDDGRMLLGRAVVESITMQKHRNSALPKSRMTNKMDMQLYTESIGALTDFLARRAGSVPFGGIASANVRMSTNGIPVNLGF